MRKIFKVLLLMSVIGMALGNTLPIKVYSKEKKDEKEQYELEDGGDRKIFTRFRMSGGKNSTQENETRKFKFVVTVTDKQEDFRGYGTIFPKFFKTRDQFKAVCMTIAKFFIIFYLMIGPFLYLTGEEPEILSFVGLVTLYIKYWF